MMMRSLAVSVVAATLVGGAGCAAPLPHYEWRDVATALSTMSRRDGAIRTFSASCRMLLDSDAGRVELTAALVAQPPERLRLRAWKFSQAVFDITLNEDGLFVLDKRQSKQASDKLQQVNHARFVEAVALLPGFERDVDWTAGTNSSADTFVIKRRSPQQGAPIECTVDKNTLVRTKCAYRDDAGRVRQVLHFDDYAVVGGTVWPMRVEGGGESGTFVLLFDRIDVNTELADRAFVPPRRAVRQP